MLWDRWDVWFVFYGTYAECEAAGNPSNQRIARGLPFAAAQRMVEEKGFGYCMKPAL